MSHCPGPDLEDWITDWWRLVDVDGQHGTSIRRLYAGQLILTKEQFQGLVEIYKPVREQIEERLSEYSEEENGSWRDYAGYAFDFIPKDVTDKAEEYLRPLRGKVPETEGIGKIKQHDHKCPRCGIDFLCRGKACEGTGPNFDREGDVYCEHCWEGMAD
jgi:hypothetical protein